MPSAAFENGNCESSGLFASFVNVMVPNGFALLLRLVAVRVVEAAS